MGPPAGVCSASVLLSKKSTKQSDDSLLTIQDSDSSAVAMQRVVHRPRITVGIASKFADSMEPSGSASVQQLTAAFISLNTEAVYGSFHQRI